MFVCLAPADRRKRKNHMNKHNFDPVQRSQFHILKANQKDTEIFVNENPSKNFMNDTVSISSSKVIKIQKTQSESFAFVTADSKGEILNTNIEDLKQQHVLKTGDNANVNKNNVDILGQGYPLTSAGVAKNAIFLSNKESIIVISFESNGDFVEQINTKTLPIISSESKTKKN